MAPTESDLVPLRLVVMGTGPFAVPMFERLLAAKRHVLALVTRPDRPVHARGSAVQNPMRELARAWHAGVRAGERQFAGSERAACGMLGRSVRRLRLRPDSFARDVGARPAWRHQFAWIALAQISRRGPDPMGRLSWRNGNRRERNPHDAAIGRRPCAGASATPIGPTETAAELEPRLAAIGADAVQEALAMLSAGKPTTGIVQDQSLASKAPRLKKTDGLVDWRRSAAAIFNQFRALQPWPKIYSFWRPTDGPADIPPMRLVLDSIAIRPSIDSPQPGTVVSAAPKLIVASGDGCIAIDRIQAAGKRSMPTAEFLRGHTIRPGDKFGATTNRVQPSRRKLIRRTGVSVVMLLQVRLNFHKFSYRYSDAFARFARTSAGAARRSATDSRSSRLDTPRRRRRPRASSTILEASPSARSVRK